ncbi:DUF4870 domain-containing protein [Jannaschia sp. R86511]|uniref:DUF4870 domain-containing protein n=1 Tax=Jannaschia sp. R86511 TaxID=3093853 RepID=UPI0036D3E1E4
MTDPNTPADPDQPPSGQPAGEPGPAQPGPYSQPGGYSQPAQPGSYDQPGGYQQPGQPGGYQQPGAYPPPGAPQPGAYQQAPVSQADEKLWGMLGHLGGIVIGFIAGLVVYLIYKDRSQYLKEQGAEALNFQITIVIAAIAASILTAVSLGILFFLPFVVWVVQIVFGILAGLAANRHENYRYPFAIRLVK